MIIQFLTLNSEQISIPIVKKARTIKIVMTSPEKIKINLKAVNIEN